MIRNMIRKNVYLEKSVLEDASKFAERYGLSFSALTNIALREFLEFRGLFKFVNTILENEEFFKQVIQQGMEGMKNEIRIDN